MLFDGLYKKAGLGRGFAVGVPTALASYLVSGLFDKKDKHTLARAIGSILLGAGVGYGAGKFFSAPAKAEVKELKKTDPEVGAELLESMYRAAQLESVKSGGNGKDKFPTDVRQIRENMPPVVQSTLYPDVTFNGYKFTPADVGGYKAKMVPSSAGKTIAFEVYPAPGYKGPSQRVEVDANGPRFMSLKK